MFGYRDDTLFGDAMTDPVEVAFFETRDLGNIDIPEYILKNGRLTSSQDRDYLKMIVSQDDAIDEIDKWYFSEIIRKYIGKRNFCKWLCKKPEDVYDSYVGTMQENNISFDEYKNNISRYEIPEDAIILADLGKEGALYVWECA